MWSRSLAWQQMNCSRSGMDHFILEKVCGTHRIPVEWLKLCGLNGKAKQARLLQEISPIPVAARSKARVCTRSLLGLWIRIPPGAWMFVSDTCCVMSGRGICFWLITRPEQSYRIWCALWVWLRSRVRGGHKPESGRRVTRKERRCLSPWWPSQETFLLLIEQDDSCWMCMG
jgi:hypothetical protein